MKIEELYYNLTGTENPKHMTKREKVIVETCLKLINHRDKIIEEQIGTINHLNYRLETELPRTE